MSKVKILENGEFIEYGKICTIPAKCLAPMWMDVMYFPFSDPDLELLAYFPKTGHIEVFSTFDSSSTVTEDGSVLAVKYDSLPILMSFYELSTLGDKEIIAILQKRKLTFKEYCDLTWVMA